MKVGTSGSVQSSWSKLETPSLYWTQNPDSCRQVMIELGQTSLEATSSALTCHYPGHNISKTIFLKCFTISYKGIVNLCISPDEFSPLRGFFGLFHADSTRKEFEKPSFFPTFTKK
jgi:hypothetical protein